jgi:hypothetical protein
LVLVFVEFILEEIFVYVKHAQTMLKEVEDNFTLLQQIKENNMMVNMKACNLMEDHNHQLKNAQL